VDDARLAVDAGKAELDRARAELDLARYRLSRTELKAPTDGVILTRIREPGAVVLPNTPVYSLAVTNPVWARTYVDEPSLGWVYPGMKAEITADSLPDKVYHGWVGFVSPTAEFTPKTVETPGLRTDLVYRLRVYVDNPDKGLRQGMPVTVHLVEGSEAATDAAAPSAATGTP